MITGQLLRRIAPTIPAARAEKLSALLNEICPLYGINNRDILHEFLANVLHESNEFNNYVESLNYSVDALIKKFGRHRITIAQAQQHGRKPGQRANQKAIANILYGGSWGRLNLGNTMPNDGWDFRGSGPIQQTGRKNMLLFHAYMKAKHGYTGTMQELAELIRTDDRIAIHSACWIFAIAKKLIQAAIDDNMKKVIVKINGGLIGEDDRMKYYARCKEFLPE